MAVRRSNRNLWDLDPKDPRAVPNARVALALLMCVRRSGAAFPKHSWDDLGAALAPVALKHARAFKAALQGHSQDQVAAGREPCVSREDHPLILTESVLSALGEGVSRDLPRFRKLVEKMQAVLERFVADHRYDGDRNLEMLTRLVELTPPEADLLRLIAASNHGTIDRGLFGFIDSASRLRRALAALLGVNATAITRLFSRGSLIARCGLLDSLRGNRGRIDLDDLMVLSNAGERLLNTPFDDEQAMARSMLTPMAAATGMALAWPHLAAQRLLLQAALAGALERRERGVNILLYGAPGTGKTEFVRQLVGDLGAHAFCVDETDAEGREASRDERLASLQLSQSFVGQAGRSVIVLDEAEDIFQSDYHHPLASLFDDRAGGSKAWINKLLENNPAPVIWISNRISQLDPAYLRRFSCCLEFPATPYALRRAIAQQRLGMLGCGEATIDFASATPEITPAHLDVAARFASLGQASGMDANAAVRFVLESHLKAGGNNAPAHSPARATRFDLRYLNIEGNAGPEAVVRSLERAGGATGPGTGTALLFAGPPGTGKTQLAAEIATRLGRRLVVRTASDINSKWYGESEGNVARMFRDCDARTELLFLDEAEILLSAREQGGHRGDRAVTAEFLRWLELFEGIFVCATNHASDFDAALMRRFTFRLEFQALRPQQRVELYAEMAYGWQPQAGQDALPVDEATRRQLERLEGLTPGDYANAARRIRTLNLPASAWLDELQAEHRAKSGTTAQRIGFL